MFRILDPTNVYTKYYIYLRNCKMVLTATSQDTCLSNLRFIVKAVIRTEASWGARDNLAPVL
jgi:hypothetical protein